MTANRSTSVFILVHPISAQTILTFLSVSCSQHIQCTEYGSRVHRCAFYSFKAGALLIPRIYARLAAFIAQVSNTLCTQASIFPFSLVSTGASSFSPSWPHSSPASSAPPPAHNISPIRIISSQKIDTLLSKRSNQFIIIDIIQSSVTSIWKNNDNLPEVFVHQKSSFGIRIVTPLSQSNISKIKLNRLFNFFYGRERSSLLLPTILTRYLLTKFIIAEML